MSARDIICQIEALPPEEQREVRDYLARKEIEQSPVLRGIDTATATAVSERVFAEHANLLRKLAQ
jgi:hypothetical protein